MTRKEVLEWARDIACEKLFEYSANYAMTRAKPGCEQQHRECLERIELLEEMLEDV